jgi:hypothetical protein
MKDILSRRLLPEKFRLAVAKNVENRLFSKVSSRTESTCCDIRTNFGTRSPLIFSL